MIHNFNLTSQNNLKKKSIPIILYTYKIILSLLPLALILIISFMEIILQNLDPKEAYLKWFSDNNKIRPNGRRLLDLPNISFKSGNTVFYLFSSFSNRI